MKGDALRITNLTVENLKAIKLFSIEDLPDAVVIAGPNGCGKSSVFDAIRLLKSAYGQYNQSEYEWWFNEFQINVRDLSREAARVLNDPTRGMLIEAEIELAASERAFLLDNAAEIGMQFGWRRIMGGDVKVDSPVVVQPRDKATYGSQVEKDAKRLAKALQTNLQSGERLIGRLSMTPKGEVTISEAPALEMAFTLYEPSALGIIDYHGANRSYGKEKVANINLAIAQTEEKSRQHALYNTQNKYSNIKTEMASAYVREVLASKAMGSDGQTDSLIDTLKELFEVFFPGKRFLGPRPMPDGSLRFPVEITGGGEHDIDELSSGEKEVLLGYLRLRNSAPRNSVILLDEPELHLNPRLIRGLPRFYQRHIGEGLGNQLWMVTHSDTLLRDAVEEPKFAVFHMQVPAGVRFGENQAISINATGEIDRALIDLVGDLATYSPQAKVVLLEGGGRSDVDASIIEQLFPEFAQQVTLVSSGSKNRVRELHEVLERAVRSGKLHTRVFSIVDRDADDPLLPAVEHRFAWDVYHVENYLLHSAYIKDVVDSLALGQPTLSESDIENRLRDAAGRTIPGLVRNRMEQVVWDRINKSISLGGDPRRESVGAELHEAVGRSVGRLDAALKDDLDLAVLENQQQHISAELIAAIESNTWKVTFRGRDILRRFTADLGLGIPYERFRNLVINRMRQDGYQPPGMTAVIQAILNS